MVFISYKKFFYFLSMVAEMFQNQNFHFMFYTYVIWKFDIYYKFNIYVTYFIVHLLDICMYIIRFLFLLHILFLYYLILNLCDNAFIFITYAKLLQCKFLIIKKIYILIIRIFYVIWKFDYMALTLHSAGKVWSLICMQDNVKPVLHYQICLTDCSLLDIR